MTAEEKQLELIKHKDILLATLDYLTERLQSVNNDEYHLTPHFQQLKKETEVHFQKGRLTRLKQWIHNMTEEFIETGDSDFGRYIKEKTGYDIDIFRSFQKRIDKIIERKKIKTENDYRDVLAMVDNLCQQSPPDQNKIDILNNLLTYFDDKIRGTKTPKSKRKIASKEQ